jgi:gamma-glutamyl-gamma-aminobutyraldehyde dehydrogenase
LQVLPEDGLAVGEPLGRHMGVDMVTFTGSTDSGRRFLYYAADSNLKEVVLECGGKSPAVVMLDVANLDHLASHVTQPAFWNMGENCSATSRMIVHREVKAPLMDRIETHMRNWRIGVPLDPVNALGVMIDAEHCAKVRGSLDGDETGPFTTPVMVEVGKDDPRAREEIFGPVLSVIEVATDDEAVALANDTDYRLSGFGGRDNGIDAHDQYT